MDELVMDVLKASFRLEISNQFEFQKNAIIVRLANGDRFKISAKVVG